MISKKDIKSIPLKGNVNFREQKIDIDHSALLIIDLQKSEYNSQLIKEKPEDNYMWDRIRNIVLPNGKKIIEKCRQNKIEVIYTVIESYTKDGRDRGIDYKISGIFCPKNSEGAEAEENLQSAKKKLEGVAAEKNCREPVWRSCREQEKFLREQQQQNLKTNLRMK